MDTCGNGYSKSTQLSTSWKLFTVLYLNEFANIRTRPPEQRREWTFEKMLRCAGLVFLIEVTLRSDGSSKKMWKVWGSLLGLR